MPRREGDCTAAAGLTVGLVSLTFGFEAVSNGGTRNGMPAFPFFMFGAVGRLGAAGDARILRGLVVVKSSEVAAESM